jgi:hypothetical protein
VTKRTIARVVLFSVGGMMIAAGAAATSAGVVVNESVGSDDALRTSPQIIQTPGCSTVVMEIADIRVDGGDLEEFAPLSERATAALTLRPTGVSEEPWLVGSADQKAIEQQLLGARYCLVQVQGGAWSTTSIAIQADSPDPAFSGIPGRWAQVASDDAVALPLPESGSSIVVSGSEDSTLETVEVRGQLRIQGASQLAWLALVGGLITAGLGVALVLVAALGLRRKGRHEGPATSPAAP